MHGLFAPAFANRQTLPEIEISASTLMIVHRTTNAALPQHFAATTEAVPRQISADRPKFKYSQLLIGESGVALE
jgi:hypothetical protein